MHLGAASDDGRETDETVEEVELPIGLGGFAAYQPQMNSECLDRLVRQ